MKLSIISIFMTLAFPMLANAPGEIYGKIINKSGNPAYFAKLIFTNTKSKERFETQTDANGEFRIAMIPEGRYSVEILNLPWDEALRKVVLKAGQSVEYNLRLKYHDLVDYFIVSYEAPIVCFDRTEWLGAHYSLRDLDEMGLSSHTRSIQGTMEMTGGVTGR